MIIKYTKIGKTLHTKLKGHISLKEKNIILVGDDLKDNLMISRIKYKNILKIGYSNFKDKIQLFEKDFDIILNREINFTYPLNIIKIII